jgi:hypothetical protein
VLTHLVAKTLHPKRACDLPFGTSVDRTCPRVTPRPVTLRFLIAAEFVVREYYLPPGRAHWRNRHGLEILDRMRLQRAFVEARYKLCFDCVVVRQPERSKSEENPEPNGRSLFSRAEHLLMTLQATLSMDQFKIFVMRGLASVQVLPTGTWVLVAASSPSGSLVIILPTYTEQQIGQHSSPCMCVA